LARGKATDAGCDPIKVLSASIRFSKGKVKVSSTSSFSSSGFAGLVVITGFEVPLVRELTAIVRTEALGVGRVLATSAGVADTVSTGEGAGVATAISGDDEGEGAGSTGEGAGVAPAIWVDGDGEGNGSAGALALATATGEATLSGVACGDGVSTAGDGDSSGEATGPGVGAFGLALRGRCCAINVSPFWGSSVAKLKLSLAPNPSTNARTPATTPAP
jgi:hypothetical protein